MNMFSLLLCSVLNNYLEGVHSFRALLVSHPGSHIMMMLTIWLFFPWKPYFLLLLVDYYRNCFASQGEGLTPLTYALVLCSSGSFCPPQNLFGDWKRFFCDSHLCFNVKLFISWENTALSQTCFFWTPGLPPGCLVLPPFPFEDLVQQLPIQLWLVFLLDCLLAIMSCYIRSSMEKRGDNWSRRNSARAHVETATWPRVRGEFSFRPKVMDP